ncbi:MAG: glycoside hydrolase family 1 protein [Actinobacteria bacterium]|nr:glycoside hydrolase family 1 protein [Actinomycetota bacterium]
MRFPENFILGTATSAFQIEGESETEWLGFKGDDGTFLGNSIDHYRHVDEDIEYILYLGNAYRFSMDWSKLQRSPFAQLEKDAVKHYEKIFKSLKNNGKKVFLVLNHFSNPLWMYKTGCWTNKDSAKYFFDYSKKVLDVFSDYIDILNTFNEPNAYVNLAYLFKTFKPGRFNPVLRKIALSNMAKAHLLVYEHVKAHYPNIITGISHAHMQVKVAGNKYNPSSYIIKNFFDFIQHEPVHEYFTAKGRYADYIGFSYYGRIQIDRFPLLAYQEKGAKRLDELKIAHDDMWEIYPRGIYEQIKFFYEKYKKPLIICENGTCTNDDYLRKYNIYNHLSYIKKACDENLPVIGYFHWSTFDNFELTHGPTRRFGLVSVDFSSPRLKRKIKESGHYYHNIVDSNSLKEI